MVGAHYAHAPLRERTLSVHAHDVALANPHAHGCGHALCTGATVRTRLRYVRPTTHTPSHIRTRLFRAHTHYAQPRDYGRQHAHIPTHTYLRTCTQFRTPTHDRTQTGYARGHALRTQARTLSRPRLQAGGRTASAHLRAHTRSLPRAWVWVCVQGRRRGAKPCAHIRDCSSRVREDASPHVSELTC